MLLYVYLYVIVIEYFYKPESVVVAEVMIERYTILDDNQFILVFSPWLAYQSLNHSFLKND
jgi:hypothetical protein